MKTNKWLINGRVLIYADLRSGKDIHYLYGQCKITREPNY